MPKLAPTLVRSAFATSTVSRTHLLIAHLVLASGGPVAAGGDAAPRATEQRANRGRVRQLWHRGAGGRTRRLARIEPVQRRRGASDLPHVRGRAVPDADRCRRSHAEHAAIVAGGSIGAVFAARGWQVVKTHLQLSGSARRRRARCAHAHRTRRRAWPSTCTCSTSSKTAHDRVCRARRDPPSRLSYELEAARRRSTDRRDASQRPDLVASLLATAARAHALGVALRSLQSRSVDHGRRGSRLRADTGTPA